MTHVVIHEPITCAILKHELHTSNDSHSLSTKPKPYSDVTSAQTI